MTARRSIRLSVPAELYERVEYFARVWQVPAAEAARRMLAAGATFWDALAERESTTTEETA